MKMKKLAIILFAIFITNTIFSQEVVSTAGETKKISGYEISWTIGEPVIQTLSSGNSIITQGFHQTKLIITKISVAENFKSLVSVYPNPTKRVAILEFKEIPEKKSFKVFDLSGKILLSKKINAKITPVDLSKFATGSYLLQIMNDNNQSMETFKIVKQ